uniref:Uncharacterized protein n=1 Tax=Anguilla anguilla TaxID=7936 RepID=A0A0E9XSB1_ANGAN
MTCQKDTMKEEKNLRTHKIKFRFIVVQQTSHIHQTGHNKQQFHGQKKKERKKEKKSFSLALSSHTNQLLMVQLKYIHKVTGML